MKSIDKNITVGELAVQHPEVKPLLERLGLDYCCGGAMKLEDAAQKGGRSLDEVLAAIQAFVEAMPARPAPQRDWNAATATELVTHIEDKHHVFMKKELPRIDDLLKKVIAAHEAHHGDLLRKVQREFLGLRQEIEMHLMKEEQVLFPYIRELDAWRPGEGAAPASHCGTVRNPIRQMIAEHEDAGGALARMRQLTGDYALPPDACPTFATLYERLAAMEADLHEHIHLENNILFPRSIEIEEKACGPS